MARELFRANEASHLNPAFTSTLASAVSTGATSFTVATGDGAKLPSPTNGDWFRLRIGTNAAPEVVRVTARSGDVLTCDALVADHAASAEVVWTVSGETLEELQGAGGTITVSPYLEYVTLLLDMNTGPWYPFKDWKNNYVTPYGSVALSTGEYYSGNASAYFSTTSDKLVIPSTGGFGFGTGDFTVSLWAKFTFDSAVHTFADFRIDEAGYPFLMGVSAGGTLRSYDGSTVRAGGALNSGAWNHAEWGRKAGVNRLFANGSQGHTWTATQDFGKSNPLVIGHPPTTNNEPFGGYMDQIVAYKGICLHDSGFTPGTVTLPPVGAYYMKGWDAAGSKYVYWAHRNPNAYPTQTWPAATGAVTNITPLFLQTAN